jgi:hypothetical protein
LPECGKAFGTALGGIGHQRLDSSVRYMFHACSGRVNVVGLSEWSPSNVSGCPRA